MLLLGGGRWQTQGSARSEEGCDKSGRRRSLQSWDLPAVDRHENTVASASFSLAPVLPYPSAKTLCQDEGGFVLCWKSETLIY